ncbi:hypothetical protein ACVRW4_08485 [Streptococcus phocae subsp. phocae]
MWKVPWQNGFRGNVIINKIKDNLMGIILTSVALGILIFVAPDIINSIFNIGKDVGQALAKWF